MRNESMLLRDAAVEPTESVLKNVLGDKLFDVYREIQGTVISGSGLEPEWRFYKDGNAWLCKVTHKKKTVFWLSIWKGFIKTGFYFTEKTRPGVYELPVDPEIKKRFAETEPAGKLIALILDVDRKEQLSDLKEIAVYKKSLK